jgi:hypothetical protein
MVPRSPCMTCKHLEHDKNVRRCAACQRRIAYVGALEQAVECRQDLCRAEGFSLPRSLGRQVGAGFGPWEMNPSF